MKRSLVLLILLISLTGCNEADTVSYKSEKGFSFSYLKEQWSPPPRDCIPWPAGMSLENPNNRMSRNYKFHNPEALYFVSFAVVNWLDVFTR